MSKKIAGALINFYRIIISPLLAGLGCRCRFHPTCSEYALSVFRGQRFLTALCLAALRILKCGPWHEGGVDQAPLPEGER